MRTEQEVRSAGPPAPRSPRNGRWLGIAAVVLLLAALLGRFLFADDAADPAGPPATAAPGPSPALAAIAAAQTALEASPNDPRVLSQLGNAFLLRARETADPTFYVRAEEALSRSNAQAPDDVSTLVGLALLDLSRHEFPRAIERGRRALQIDPFSAEALGVVVDAQVELGRYDDAVGTVQSMLDRKPNIGSWSRVSYVRELLGDPAGALSAMTSAVIAGSSTPADTAYVQTLLGDLHRGAGRLAPARSAYDTALASVPRYPPAEVGLARVDAALGDLDAAATRLETAVPRLPLPDYIAFRGDVLAALGRSEEAAQQYALVRVTAQLESANGVVVDLETARFEADHARDSTPALRPAELVALARAAYAARPTIYGHDTLGWALRQAGSPRAALPEADAALARGTRDATLWYHRAVIHADLGNTAEARRDLTTALSINPALTLRDLPAARDLAGRLGVPMPPVRR